MIALEGIDPKKIVVMPVPRIPHSGSTATDIRAELGLAAGTPVIGVAAVMRRQKALDVLLDAHARLLTEIPNAHLVLAGDGPCREELKLHVEKLGTGASVHFVGRRNDIDAILRSADVAAMSSDYEGMPLFALECMAVGTPLVATAVGGIPDIVTHEKSALLVPPRDPAALADAMRRILTDHELSASLVSAARVRSRAFSIDSVALQFADLYEQLVAEVRPDA